MSRPLEEARIDSVRTLIARLSLRRKLYLVMVLGLLAVVTPSLVTPLLAERDESSLKRIERELVPASEASREMMRTLERAHEGVQLASVAADPSALRAFDATRHEALEHLETLKHAEPPIAPSLASAVEAYVRKAQGAIERSLAGSTRTGELAATLEAFDALRPRVARQIELRRTMLARGFATASITRERGQRAAMIGGFVLLLTFFFAMRLIVLPTAAQLAHVRAAFERFATGDFATEVPVLTEDELGALALAVNATSKRLDELVLGLRSTAAQLNTAAAEMSATSNQHQRGASEQSSAVEETQRTMQSMLASMDQINGSIDSVLANAEQTQAKNQLIAESIVTLSTQADGIAEVLATIKDIANKAELLALNAALEGTKAGEVGRGFSLVATQMQRLAENVQRAVADIKQLTESIRRASTASVLATEEGTKLATDTTRSAREIRFVMQQHQTATRQVTAAMDDVASVAQQTAASSREILTSSQDLTQLSERLLETTSRLGADVGEGQVGAA